MSKQATLTTPIPSVEATAAQYGVGRQDLERVRKAVGMILASANPRPRVKRTGRTHRASRPVAGRTRAKK